MSDFDSIVGYGPVKQELEQIADYLKNPERYGPATRMPSGILLAGEPGLGKTLMAECLIKASGLQSFACRKTKHGADMLEAISKAFDSAAECAPAIVFLDDLDKYSNCDYDLRDAEEYVTVQSCLDAHRGEGVFIIATANDEKKLPKSLLRPGRFDRMIGLTPPSGKDALAIAGHYLRRVTSADDLDAQRVADITSGCACALIETAINDADLLQNTKEPSAFR